MTAARFVVTGPGEPERQLEAQNLALSLAITYACRATVDATFYVRDAGDVVRHYVERTGDTVLVHTPKGGRP